MNVIRRSIVGLVLVAFAVVDAASALAQQSTGEAGSPTATTTVDGRYIIHRRRSAASSTSTPRPRRPSGLRPSFRQRERRMCC